mgnify:CR=1 FL=1
MTNAQIMALYISLRAEEIQNCIEDGESTPEVIDVLDFNEALDKAREDALKDYVGVE